MERLPAEQRAGVMGAVLAVHLAAILALLATRIVVTDAADEQPALAVFDVATPPPPAIAPPIDEPEPPPPGPERDRRAPAPAPVLPQAVAAPPPPPASVAVEAVVRLPVPIAAPAAPVAGSGVDGIGGGASGGDGGGLGGGGTGSADAGAKTPKRFHAARWLRRPPQQAWDAVWPRVHSANGKRRRLSGEALLACEVRPDGRPHACSVVAEQPRNRGIGRAAVALLRRSRVRPVLEDGEPVDLPVLVQINFNVRGDGKETPRPVQSSP